ncbi:MAG: orotate phosphoribosyltransferase [Devosiaceae bacterium]|nr:orotate phosphoribosyltransferase [Devosiaceae bacterium]
MSQKQVLDIFADCGAILHGHFILTSGLRSATYLQKALVFRQPEKAQILCSALAQKITEARLGEISQIVAPAMGGVIPGYETARHLGLPAIFTERVEGKFQLRRGFEIFPGEKIIVVDDIISTGISIRECIACVEEMGGDVIAAACLIDRSAGEADIGVKLIKLIDFKVSAYSEDELPAELAAIPPIKPGSRGLA